MSSSLGAMGSLPGKLRSLLVSSKSQLPDPLKDEIKLLIQELDGACTLLVDLSRAGAIHPMLKLWRDEVREMSYDLEDYIDKTRNPYSNEFDVEEFRILVELARDACESYHRYHLGSLWPSNPSLAGRNARVQMLNREVKETIGIDDARHKLISRIRGNSEHEQGLKLVAIQGPAGVGKTTLAQEVYRKIGVEFECRAFVRVSRMPDTRWLLQSIISQIQRNQRPCYDYTVQMLIDNLSEYLHHKRYFIVIDGLWEVTSWDIISSAFPVGNYCSRILVTTDIEEVALACSDYQSEAIFLMEPLSRDYSAVLLNNRVSCYKHELFEQLKEHLEDIIRTCGGLPLATISIANILASQPDNSQLWCQVKECLSSRLRNNLTSEGVLREIVGLSYDCLSQDLKVCLLYLSVYPEGYTFMKADLLKQWMAEGFISEIQENAEEVAESYFDELVCRGLIQPDHIHFSNRMVSYTVHSSMFDVIRCKSIEDNFTTVIDYSNTIPDLSAKVRRLSLRCSNAKYATKPEGITLSPVRSLIFFGLVECLPSIMEFEVLRILILDVWGDQEELDLSGMDRLFQLRYVKITTDIIVKLPTKMSGLQYLETLEIFARVTTVPSDIVHLPSLLHLCLLGEVTLSDGINHMRSLRTLKSFDLTRNSENNVRSVGEMIYLHDLHLTCSTASSDHLKRNLIALASSLEKHDKLKSLVLAPGASMPSMYLDCSSRVSSMPISLQRLVFLPPICIFSRLPEWIGQLQNLCILEIVVRELTRDDVNRIGMLQELTVLSLYVQQPTAERIIFKRTAFPVLKYFKFRCGILRLWFQVEAMPNLQSLDLKFNAHKGEQYGYMIAGIEHLFNLQEITVRIGAASGAEESDRAAAESAIKDTICTHSRQWSFSIGRVDSIIEETADISDRLGSSPRSVDCTPLQVPSRPDKVRSGQAAKEIAGGTVMPVTDYKRSSSTPFSCGRSLLSPSRDTTTMPLGVEADLEAFQRHVAVTLTELLPKGERGGDAAAVAAAAAVVGDEFLSVAWIQRLLEGFVTCQEVFRGVLAQARRRGELPAGDEKMVAEFHERAVKALDICNAASDGVNYVRRWARVADMAASVLRAPREIRHGQFRRARKALSKLPVLLTDDTAASGSGGVAPSFGHAHATVAGASWSAARSLQAVGAGLAAPHAHGAGLLAAPVYSMGCVLHLTAWALVAAFPCTDCTSSLQVQHLPAAPPPAAFPWAPPLLTLQRCLAEEEKGRRHSCGLLKEICSLERSTRRLAEHIDRETDVRQAASQLAVECEVMTEGLGNLERRVREVFRSIAHSLMEGLNSPMHNAAIHSSAGSAATPDDRHEEDVTEMSVGAATLDHIHKMKMSVKRRLGRGRGIIEYQNPM